jgi:hypothetical protein
MEGSAAEHLSSKSVVPKSGYVTGPGRVVPPPAGQKEEPDAALLFIYRVFCPEPFVPAAF